MFRKLRKFTRGLSWSAVFSTCWSHAFLTRFRISHISSLMQNITPLRSPTDIRYIGFTIWSKNKETFCSLSPDIISHLFLHLQAKHISSWTESNTSPLYVSTQNTSSKFPDVFSFPKISYLWLFFKYFVPLSIRVSGTSVFTL